MFKKLHLNLIVIGVISLTAIGLAGGTVLASYLEYQKYYEENYPEIDPTDYATLTGLRAEIKEGVKYYKNYSAKPRMTDLIVTGRYKPKNDQEPEFEYVVDPEKKPYLVTTNTKFAFEGGTITVTYSGLNAEIKDVKLEDVILKDIEITKSPYVTKYQTNQIFNTAGMVVNALYNDGTKKELSGAQYHLSKETALNPNDNKITISYTEGSVTKSKDISISVVASLNNGEIRSIDPVDNHYLIDNGNSINEANIAVVATYQSGNRFLINKSAYNITNENATARLGKKYALHIALKENSQVTTTIPLYVRNHIEGETGDIIGGSVKTEDEYYLVNGVITKGNPVTFAGDFAKAVTKGNKSSVSYNVLSYANNKADITFKVANSFLDKIENDYWMKPLLINSILDLKVNDEKVKIGEDVILRSFGPSTEYPPLYNIYSDITFENVPLKAGNNNISLVFKKSTLGEVTSWNESPSTMNIDYLDVISSGHQVDDKTKIKRIEIDSSFKINYGDNFDTLDIPVYATYENDDVEILDNSQLNITKPSGYASIGTHTINVSLKSDTSISTSKTFVVNALTLEAENAVKSGSTKVKDTTEYQYLYNDNTGLYEPNGTITAVKGMDNSATNYSGETSLTFSFNGALATQRLIVRCSNAYYNQDEPNHRYSTQAVNLQDVVEIYVNDVKLNFNVLIPGIDNVDNPDVCWMTFYELDVGDVQITNGNNTIKIVAKKSAPRNYWNECSIPRFDHIKISA